LFARGWEMLLGTIQPFKMDVISLWDLISPAAAS
jgi:hypothetical protein